MRPLHLVIASLLAFSMTACGDDEEKTPDAGTPINVEEYFGLQVGRCFEYTVSDVVQESPSLGMVVEAIEEGKTFEMKTYRVSYRTGTVAMTDYFTIEGNELKLVNRAIAGGRTYRYVPPITFARAPMEAGDRVESASEGRVFSSSGELVVDPPATHTMRVDAHAVTDLQLPAGPRVSGVKLIFSETPPRGEKAHPEARVLVPGSGDRNAIDGWVVIENNFTSDDNQANVIYKLQRVRDLGADADALTMASCGLGL